MSKLSLSKRDQTLFVAGLGCILITSSISALFGDSVVAWLRHLFQISLLLGSGLLLVYIVRVSRKR